MGFQKLNDGDIVQYRINLNKMLSSVVAIEYKEFRVGQEILDTSIMYSNIIHSPTAQKEVAQHPSSFWMFMILIDPHQIRTWDQ